MLLSKLSKLLMGQKLVKLKKQHRAAMKESFDARLKMEEHARSDVNARLRVIELQLKNQGRVK